MTRIDPREVALVLLLTFALVSGLELVYQFAGREVALMLLGLPPSTTNAVAIAMFGGPLGVLSVIGLVKMLSAIGR